MSEVRYNHPSNWPAAPEGWAPTEGWQPDPAWGPPPEGWQFWLPAQAAPPPAESAMQLTRTATLVPDTYASPPNYPLAAPGTAYPASQRPSQKGPLGKDRSPAGVLGLSIVTLGIYYLVWYGKIQGEIRRHDPSIKVTPALAVIAAMLPIFGIVTAYSTAARIRQMQLDCGQQQTISPVVALLLIMFLGIGYPLYVASQLREHWHGHRQTAGT